MSYILDALKKSEQERGQGNIPDVQTVHSSSLNYRNEKKAYWPYFLIAAVLLNLLAIIYFITEKQTPEKTAALSSKTTGNEQATINKENASEIKPPEHLEITEQATIIVSKKTETMVEKEEPENIKTDNSKPQAAENSKSTATKNKASSLNNETEILAFHELPENIKNSLPSFVISAHVYSSNPMQRSIVINNNFLEEGEYILDDLILHEITPDGAIFNYQGTLFSYGVVSGWQ